ncbi:MAG: hypothetical protein HY784_08850, partial [Chloroflexi bacterium]|nr:hypothetical protein [Chloroflexota bacterium]
LMRSQLLRYPVLGITILALLLTACGAPATSAPTSAPATAAPVSATSAPAPTEAPTAVPTEAPPAHVEVLRMGGGDYGYPSPYGFTRGPGYVRALLIFDTLVWKDASGEIIPWLATAWSSSEDGLTWTFTLRDQVTWHDGQPLTAADVVFTVDYFKANPNPWTTTQINVIESVTQMSENQVEFKLAQPYAPFLPNTVGALIIIPKHIWEGVADPKAFTGPEAVIGTGPYTLTEYNKEEGAYLFEANHGYFLGDPYVQRIEFVPTSDALLALANGELDMGDAGVQTAVSDEVLAPFRQPPFGIIDNPGEWTMGLYFNLAADSPLADVRVRQAIAYALDLQDMVDRLLLGAGTPGSSGLLPPANPYHNPELSAYPHDVEKAAALLDEAGYTDDGSGVRQNDQGVALQFDLTYASSDSPRNAELIQGALAGAGIQVNLGVVDRATRDAAATDCAYQMILVGFGGLGGDPDMLRRNFASTSRAQGFTRAQGYANPDFDALANQQISLTDDAARREAIHQMQVILSQDVPVIHLYYPLRVTIFNADVLDGWYYTPGGFAGGIPTAFNKHFFITGEQTGLVIRGTD